ncbi:Ig-like domain repeat protein [Nocardioides limicola]|uniref:Ig-like domain repeat protein n=1 Tax=Nocardioides limicola TaxID=2803368 RepID=UPI00193C2E3E|nr:Ig-like domain repeat protein [Nocardioides sp. DJM-14]
MRTGSIRLAAMLAIALAALIAVPAAASSYQPSARTSLQLQAGDLCFVSEATFRATVNSDAATQSPEGRVTFSLNGQVLASSSVNANGVARLAVPNRDIPRGDNQVEAVFEPAAGSNFTSSSARSSFTKDAPNCADVGGPKTDETKGGTSPIGGLLPNTGGFWWWLLLLAAIALGVGYYLVRKARDREVEHV